MFPITENGSQENNIYIIKYGPFFEVIQFLNLYNDITRMIRNFNKSMFSYCHLDFLFIAYK